ncbi:Fe(3+) ABC transporter substrate-binding protein [Kangiella sediminilitoris]|uniref:Extracellular solute-binding protein family 1 n=1 Tax=Kangiella sediminilitoris TaxID=1144748 RepID=A0A1B3B7X8_9GAMM|nr:Fe(3+) ABC transporter substrate-binding protein [Kangiella sediminilitoris]AOE48886.1 Extracellular solute-binding protein family 1 [Kangiella sediminilitoris]
MISTNKWLLALSLGTVLGLTACDDSEQQKPQTDSNGEAQETAVGDNKPATKEPTPKEIVVYSSRKEHLIKPFFEQFTEETGIPVIYITDAAAPLISRLKSEGERSPADILMTVDAGNLWQATQEQILQPIDSEILEANIPESLQDPDNEWFGLTVRARTIVYSKERVNPDELSTYEALGDEQWKGRVCLRTSKKVYNQSLVAMLIARHGEEKAQKIVEGWVANLATDPFSNDTKVMKAIEAGACDVGIVNTYYFGRLEKEDPQIPLSLFWPNQETSGVHVNISGAGITKHSSNVENATKLIEWLSSAEAQKMYAGLNMEYPANPNVEPVEEVEAWGSFTADDMNLSKAGELQPQAVKVMDRAGYK